MVRIPQQLAYTVRQQSAFLGVSRGKSETIGQERIQPQMEWQNDCRRREDKDGTFGSLGSCCLLDCWRGGEMVVSWELGGGTAWEQDSLEDPLCFALLLPCRL